MRIDLCSQMISFIRMHHWWSHRPSSSFGHWYTNITTEPITKFARSNITLLIMALPSKSESCHNKVLSYFVNLLRKSSKISQRNLFVIRCEPSLPLTLEWLPSPSMQMKNIPSAITSITLKRFQAFLHWLKLRIVLKTLAWVLSVHLNAPAEVSTSAWLY